ncbi:MAG: Pyrophosphate--fructose 6-phosphate 1-phosphotransferase [Syntrophus sp. PtaB.Bin001]|nr:MAG: Pyrophosphate--fructose 6-phosphate 1-phosphotransferase [Syntrophus sp. PtaB.Bin001]
MGDLELDFTIERLGECRIPSPVRGIRFMGDDGHVLYHSHLEAMKPWLERGTQPPAMEAAGPREKIFFDPSKIACGIVTCGGICPGLNDVIRSIVFSLHYHYGVRKVYGFRFGYEGLVQRYGHTPLELTPDSVSRIHEIGGTILGSSRGPQEPSEMVSTLADLNVGILFTVGGDGTQRGAQKIAEEATRRGLKISIVGIPKTIDNDISYIQATFGFETAVTEARRATYAANTEAEAARNSIGLVKLMGRDSGFIAAYSVLVNSHVNFCLVPEVPFSLDGFLGALRQRLERKCHAVVVVAEGAGQTLMEETAERDASGNIKYGDIGIFLRDAIKDYFKQAKMEINLKYIDPSYMIRSMPANPHDSAFCLLLGQSAVHAGMSGRTNMVVSFWNHQFTHVPITLAVSQRKKIDPQSMLWNSVLAVTGQPDMV